jgi:23S rRNA (cytosine1962-C5)-methyltransferase
VRLLSADANAEIGREFFSAKFKQALSLREAFFDKPYYRLVHAEGDYLPGLVIDRFGGTAVVQVTTAGMENLIEPLLAALNEVITPDTIVLRNDAPSRALEGLENYVGVAKGAAPTKIMVEENGAQYFADPQTGQKSGWYYDQRENRVFMAGLAKNKRVLDAYCYSGGFGILAARARALEVIGLDSSELALTLAAEAVAANDLAALCKFVKADVMVELERLGAAGERFDIVICDPPPFVRARKDLEPGAKAYRKLARLAASVTAPGGFLMLCSCSHNVPLERFMLECAAGIGGAGRIAALIRSAGAGPDHPVHSWLPESAYLKALTYRPN